MPAVLDRPTTKNQKATRQIPATQQQAVVPMAGETQFQFFDRAMRAMRQQVPAINQRTVAVLRFWRDSPNAGSLIGKAVRHFPDDKFTHFGPRCVFIEHEIPACEEETNEAGEVTSPGREGILYGRKEFEKLVNWANYRIANADTFSALSTGHTPSRSARDSGAEIPPALGWVGPFYLGMFGDIDPQWAIYADEWIHNEDVPKFERLPRRSPEVWHREPMESRTMDPIAALGSGTPRLDSGMGMASYCRGSDDREVTCYSAMSFPGASNAFIPSNETGSKHKYGDAAMPFGQTDQQAAPPASGLDPQIIGDAVSKAIDALKPTIVQSVIDSLGGSEVPPEEEDFDEEPNLPRGVEQPMPDETQEDGHPMDGGQPAAPTAEPEVPLGDDEKRQYAAMSPECQSSYMTGRKKGASMVQQYSRSGFDGLKNVVKNQQAQIGKMQSDARDVQMYSRVETLGRTKQLVGKDGKAATAKQLLGEWFDAGLTHEQMSLKLETITQYARERDDDLDFNLFNDPHLDVEQYSRNGHTPRPRQPNPGDVEFYERARTQAIKTVSEKNFKSGGKEVANFGDEFDDLIAHPEKVAAKR